MSADEMVFNGLDAVTGKYLTPPMAPANLAALIQKASLSESVAELRELRQRSSMVEPPVWSSADIPDPRDLAETGWGVIFPAYGDEAVRAALGELLEWRREAAAQVDERLYREFSGPQGYRPGEAVDDFLARHGVGPGPTGLHELPYYLLLVGDPESIPEAFQRRLSLRHAIGRLHFETLEEYARYAHSVVMAENQRFALPRRAAFFAPTHPDDRATQLYAEYLAAPLARGWMAEHPDWTVQTALGGEATKGRLAGLLGGPETPAMLFTASHGLGFPSGNPRQLAHQGALLCADWPGPAAWGGAIPPDFEFSAGDLDRDARLFGLVAFHFASYAAGAPKWDELARLERQERVEAALQAFPARLPQRLLSHPQGGALAVVGPAGRAWGYSFMWGGNSRQTGVFQAALDRLARGYPVGAALDPFLKQNAEYTLALQDHLEKTRYGTPHDPSELAGLWTAWQDARSLAVLGDPAVRLMIAEPGAAEEERPVIRLASSPRTAAVETQAEASPTQPGRKFIVVIGIDDYAHWPRLRTAVSDARGVRALFLRLGFQELTSPLFNGDATRAALDALLLDELPARLQAEDSLVLFFAGHGHTVTTPAGDTLVKESYLIPADGSSPGARRLSSYLRLDALFEQVGEQLPARHVLVILDTFSHGLPLGGAAVRRALPADRADQERRSSRHVIVSALEGQPVLDSGPIPGFSLFAGALIEALNAGKADPDGKGFVTSTELARYLERTVGSLAGAQGVRQTPAFGSFAGQDAPPGELVIPLPAGTEGRADPPRVWLYLGDGKKPAQMALLESAERLTWGANPHTRAGDLVLMYRTAPFSDIRCLFRAAGDAYPRPVTPTWPWEYAAELADKTCLEVPLPLVEIRQHPALSGWSMAHSPQGALGRVADIRQEGYWEALRGLLVARNPAIARTLAGWETVPPGELYRQAVEIAAQSPDETARRELLSGLLPLLPVADQARVRSLLEPASPRSGFPQGWALVVGGSSRLLEVEPEAQAIAALLADPGHGAYPPEQVRRLTGAAVTRAGILAALEAFARAVPPAATALVYITGDAARWPTPQGEQYYLECYDTLRERLPETAVGARELAGRLAALQAHNLLVVLDVSHAAGFLEAVAGPIQAARPASSQAGDTPGGLALIGSSEEKEYAQAGRPYSPFARAWLDAFQTGAPAKPDGSLWVSSLADALRLAVIQATGGRQHPEAILRGEDFPIGYIRREAAKPARKARPRRAKESALPAPAGKGIFLWHLEACAGGDPQRLAQRAAAAGFRWAALKVVDGRDLYHPDPTRAAARALRAAGLAVWGWGYSYGKSARWARDEAAAAADAVTRYGLEGFIVNAEREYAVRTGAGWAGSYLNSFRASGIPPVPLGLASFYLPSRQPEFPWSAFLSRVDFGVPILPWSPGQGLGAAARRAAQEWAGFRPGANLRLAPLGAPFQGATVPPAAVDLDELPAAAHELGLPAYAWFGWEELEPHPDLWEAIAAHDRAKEAGKPAQAAGGARPSLYALLAGVNRYPSGLPQLNGCANDALAVQSLLQEQVDPSRFDLKVRLLVDGQATRQAVVDGFREHLAQAGAEDVALFYFAGCGSALEPVEGFSRDEQNTLVLYDSRAEGGWDLAAGELRALVYGVARSGAHVALVLDCGASAQTGGPDDARAGEAEPPRSRSAGQDRRSRPPDSFLPSPQSPDFPPPGSASGWSAVVSGLPALLLAACQAGETAFEQRSVAGLDCGLFTDALLRSLRRARRPLSYRELLGEVLARLRATQPAQTPELRVDRLEMVSEVFLSGALRLIPVSFNLYKGTSGWVLDAGRIDGLPESTENAPVLLALYPPGSGGEGPPLGWGRVLQVHDTYSPVEISGPPLEPDKVYQAWVASSQLPAVGVLLEGEPQGLDLVRVALYPQGVNSLYEDAQHPRIRLLAADGRYRITWPGEEADLAGPLSGYSPESAQRVVDRLAHIRRWLQLRELRNPITRLPAGAVQMELRQAGALLPAEGLSLELPERGTAQVEIRLRNTTERRLFCGLLDLDSRFGIQPVLSNGGTTWLEPGQELAQQVHVTIPRELLEQDIHQTEELLLLIVATEEFDASLLAQEDINRPVTPVARSVAPDFVGRSPWARGPVRSAGVPTPDQSATEWTTDSIAVTLRRPSLPAARGDYALVIGISHYPALQPVPAAVPSARAFRDWLVDPQGGGLAEQRVALLLSSEDVLKGSPAAARPQQEDVDEILAGWLEGGRPVGRRLYLYFAGLATAEPIEPVEQAAFLFANVTPRRPYGLSVSGYMNSLASSGAFDELVAFVDARGLELGPGAGPLPPFTSAPERAARRAATLILWHRRPLAPEERPIAPFGAGELGIFTAGLLEGLRGGAADPDGNVTGSGLRAFLERRVSLAGGGAISYISGEQEILVCRPSLPAATVSLRLPSGWEAGEVLMLDGQRRPILSRPAGSPPGLWTVQLRAGEYLLENRATGETKTFRVDPGQGAGQVIDFMAEVGVIAAPGGEVDTVPYAARLWADPDPLPLGGETTLFVELQPYGQVPPGELERLLEVPAAEKDLNLVLHTPPGVEILSGDALSLPLESAIPGEPAAPRATQRARFRVAARQAAGAYRLEVEFLAPSGLRRRLPVDLQVKELALESLEGWLRGGPARPVPPPDLTLEVQPIQDGARGARVYEYLLSGPRVPPEQARAYRSRALPAGWLEAAMQQLAAVVASGSGAEAAEQRERLAALGRSWAFYLCPDYPLWELFRQARTLLVQAPDGAWLPWEWLHDGQRFLGELLVLARWPAKLANARPYEFPVGGVCWTAGGDLAAGGAAALGAWEKLLQPASAPAPRFLEEGLLAGLQNSAALRGLHLLVRGPQPGREELFRPMVYAPGAQEEGLQALVAGQAPDLQHARLSLRRDRPLVALSYLDAGTTVLTGLERTWAATFVSAGCSALIGPAWSVPAQADAAFWRGVYEALWSGRSLGEAFRLGRRLAQAAAPNSLGWLAYVLWGDPLARAYRPVESEGYTVVEAVGRELDEPLHPGGEVRLRLSVRRTPPVWHTDRLVEVAEELKFEDLHVQIVAPGLKTSPDPPVPLRRLGGDYLGWVTLSVPAGLAGDSLEVQFYFLEGQRVLNMIIIPLVVDGAGARS